MPFPYTSSAQALSAAEQSAWTAYSAIKGALIQARAPSGSNRRIQEQYTDQALRAAKEAVAQLEAARGLISQHKQRDAA